MPPLRNPFGPAYDVCAIGEAMVEFNQTQPGERVFLQGFGGDTSNAIIAAARAGARTAYLSRLGADRFGDLLSDLWREEGVDSAAVDRDPTAPTGTYFITHGREGHEFSYLRAGSAASRMSPDWLRRSGADMIRSSRYLLASGVSLAISGTACDTVYEAMRVARAAGVSVAFDSNLRLKLWPIERARACIAHAVSLCDLFLPSLEDMVQLVGLREPEAIAEWGHALGAHTVILKLGEHGAFVSDGVHERIPGRPTQAVDATGAGDCFVGNLLARLAQGADVREATRWANAAASLAVRGYGAVAPLPRASDTSALLASTLGMAAR